jgi:hypothetical protein
LEAVPQAVTTDTLEEMRKLLMSKELAHRITSGKPIPPPRTRNRRRMERLALEPAETDEAESVVTDYRLNQLSEEDLNQVQQLIKGTHTDVMNTVSQYAEGFEDKFRLLASRIAQVELSANKPQYRNNYPDNRGTKPAPNMFANMICFFCGKQGHGIRAIVKSAYGEKVRILRTLVLKQDHLEPYQDLRFRFWRPRNTCHIWLQPRFGRRASGFGS